MLRIFFSQHAGTNNTGHSEDDEAAEVEQCEEHTVEETVVGVVAQMSQTGEVFAHGLRSEQVKVPAKNKISGKLRKKNLCTENSRNVPASCTLKSRSDHANYKHSCGYYIYTARVHAACFLILLYI